MRQGPALRAPGRWGKGPNSLSWDSCPATDLEVPPTHSDAPSCIPAITLGGSSKEGEGFPVHSSPLTSPTSTVIQAFLHDVTSGKGCCFPPVFSRTTSVGGVLRNYKNKETFVLSATIALVKELHNHIPQLEHRERQRSVHYK